MRGRKPAPTAIKLLHGNPGKRRLNEREPTPPIGAGAPPKELTGLALEEWHRLGPQLESMGTLTEVDAPAFIVYCKAWARYLDAEEKVKALGEIVKAPSGYPIVNPYRSISNKAYQQCKDFWSEFGMTASARTRLEANPVQTSVNPLSRFLNKRRA